MSSEAPFIECPACGQRIEFTDYYDVREGTETECSCGKTLVCQWTEATLFWSWATKAEARS